MAVIALAVSCRRAEAPRPADPPGTYAGRAIAPTMSYLAAGWLDRGDRAARERPDDVLDALALHDGMIVADVGAGSGYFTLRIARRVAPGGRVIATDVQPQMLAMIRERAAAAHLGNVETRLVHDADAGLDAGSIDLALLVDVYHELADPAAVMAGVRRALRPGGRLVLVEYRGEDPAVPIKPAHKMTLARIRAELEPMGFRVVDDLEFLPDQRVVVLTPAPASR
jgi:ubiquinone/menaquinone biosynthesis C-methylase UbiE